MTSGHSFKAKTGTTGKHCTTARSIRLLGKLVSAAARRQIPSNFQHFTAAGLLLTAASQS